MRFGRGKGRTVIASLLVMILAAAFSLSNVTRVYGKEPYQTYSFNFWGEDIIQPHAYLYEGALSSSGDGVSFSFPRDMFIFEDNLYIADTNNSRVLKMTSGGELLLEITEAAGPGDPLNKPQGVFVTSAGHLYVADTDNGRIVEYDETGRFIRSIGRPETDLIADSQAYKPTKVAVDKVGRIYAIAYGINMGLVEFSREGGFQGFMGATKVSVGAFEYLLKYYFSTEAQKSRMQTIIPTEYSNLFVDGEDFLYVTVSNLSEEDRSSGADAVRRLNPTGKDVLRRLGNVPVIGDLYGNKDTDFSQFADICATAFGCYFVLDSAGGKVFAYDYDGNILFGFGGKGNREGLMQSPSALGVSTDLSRLYVLDSVLNSIQVYKATEYGAHLFKALELNYSGDAPGANLEWGEVLRANANSELAYTGLGKTYLKEGDYSRAMSYFKLGNNRKYYAKAFYYYRKTVMENSFGAIMGGILAVSGGLFLFRRVKKIRKWAGDVRCTMLKR